MTHTDVRVRAAALLRNAALVMHYTGYTREEYLNNRTGAVCMEGAMQAAAGNPLLYDAERTDILGHSNPYHWVMNSVHQDSEAMTAAVEALIPLLPEKCDQHSSYNTCGYCDSDLNIEPTTARIHHFNDFVCTGGEEASLLLLQAAQKLEAEL